MEYIGFSMVLALLMLDRKHAFQLSLSQPLISCTLIGLITGNIMPAMYFGLLVQMIWLGNLPVGASATPEGTMASVIGCTLFVHFEKEFVSSGNFILFAAFAYTIVMSFLGGKLEIFQRTFNIKILDYAVNSIPVNTRANLGQFIFSALAVQFVFNFIFIATGINFGLLVFNLIDKEIFINNKQVFEFINLAIIGTGIGMVLSVYRTLHLKKIITAVGVLGLLILR